jgi:hypothetical protein
MDYQFVNFGEGFGVSSVTEVEELNKALEAGVSYSDSPQNRLNGGALQVESLDRSLKSVTFEEKNLKLWPIMPKDQAFNTIEEYNRITAYGDQGKGFISEGDLPRSQDSNYNRQIQRVRFIGVTRELTHVYTLVRNAHGDAMAREIRNGTLQILQISERALFDGRGMYASASGLFDGSDAAILDVASGDLAWAGLDKQIRSGDTDAKAIAAAFEGFGNNESVIADLRANILDEDHLEDQARKIQENFGLPSHMLMDTKAHSDLSRQFYPKERINPMGIMNGKAGFVLQNFVSSAGEFALMSDVFLRPKRTPIAGVSGGPAAPAAPSAPAPAADANSKFAAADAGNYYYKASAISKAGEGPVSAASAAIAVVAGDAVALAIPAVAGAYAYAVYRSVLGSNSGHEFIGFVAPAAIGGAATFKDINHKLPGLSQAYMLSLDSEVMRFKQLAPLMKMDLAIVATAYRWMQLLYVTPIVFAPRKNAISMNIGRSA